VITLM